MEKYWLYLESKAFCLEDLKDDRPLAENDWDITDDEVKWSYAGPTNHKQLTCLRQILRLIVMILMVMAGIHWVLWCGRHNAWFTLQMLFHLILSKHRNNKQVAELVGGGVKFQIYIYVTSETELLTRPPSALSCLISWDPMVEKTYLLGCFIYIISRVFIFSYEIITDDLDI